MGGGGVPCPRLCVGMAPRECCQVPGSTTGFLLVRREREIGAVCAGAGHVEGQSGFGVVAGRQAFTAAAVGTGRLLEDADPHYVFAADRPAAVAAHGLER